ncbi:MAG TPA: hypothetical protein ENO27_00035 [Caldithrix sp.]|nr:hypothetical protein [Caldithrix sp.]
MTESQLNNKLDEYTQRHRFWTNLVLNQFGFSLNLFITISIGFLGYLISTKDKYPEIVIDFNQSVNWNLVFYVFTLILVFISILSGSISIISRLYDLRLTRHIIWTRKAVFKKLNKFLPDSYINLKNESLIRTFIKVIFFKIEFIGEINADNFESIKLQFENIRKQSKILGRISWRAHKVQIVILVISVLIYGFTIF